MNGTYANGYGNGNANGYSYDQATQGRYQRQEVAQVGNEDYLGPASANQRIGGYGGLGSADNMDSSGRERAINRPTDLERRRANRRSADRGNGISRSRSRTAGGRANQQIEG
jgi:exocyst complex component 4